MGLLGAEKHPWPKPSLRSPAAALSEPAESWPNVATLRTLLAAAAQRKAQGGEDTILFIDEIQPFQQSQQDILLRLSEDGTIVFSSGRQRTNPFLFHQ